MGLSPRAAGLFWRGIARGPTEVKAYGLAHDLLEPSQGLQTAVLDGCDCRRRSSSRRFSGKALPPMLIDRRLLIKGATLGLGALAVPGWAQVMNARGFTHGVASGEPGQDRVLLWTR